LSRINADIQSLVASRQQPSLGLQHLGAGLRINSQNAEPVSTNLAADTAALRASAAGARDHAAIAQNGLNEVSALLNELEGLIATSGRDATITQEQRGASQERVDAILRSIEQVASSQSLGAISALRFGAPYEVSGVNREVEQFNVTRANIPEGGAIDINVTVTQSAQIGGFLLSFGGANIDLGSANEQFRIEIAGVNGSRELVFFSGTRVNSIADAINAVSDETGVVAVSDGTGRLSLSSESVGSEEFVSLRVVDDGNIATGDGVFQLSATNTAIDDGNAATAFSDLSSPITDFGQDIQGLINGVEAVGRGAGLSLRSESFTARIQLKLGRTLPYGTPNAQNVGDLLAFTLTETASGVVGSPDSDAGRGQNVREIASSLAELRDAGAFDLTGGELSRAQGAVRDASDRISTLLDRLTPGAHAGSVDVASEPSRAEILAGASAAVRAASSPSAQDVLTLLR